MIFFWCIGPSGAPVNFTAVAMGRTSAQFSWRPPPSGDLNGILAYYVLRIVDESFNLTDITINITNASYAIDSLEEYVRYSCQVAAATEVGVGPYSSPIVITTQQDGEFSKTKADIMQSHSPICINIWITFQFLYVWMLSQAPKV